jgi:hypothetical protein
MPVSISGTNGVTFPDSSLQAAAASPYTLKNKIINGAMVVDQRNAGASTTPTGAGGGIYTLDRWCYQAAQTGKVTVQQNAAAVTPPTGFNYYLGVTSQSSYAVLAGDYFHLYQAIEGYNIGDLAWGTASAKTITLSFWVRSSLTGTFGGALRNSAVDRSYPFTYTISVANTWELKSVTIAGDTSGTWLTTTGVGIYVGFGLGSGATYSGTANAWGAGNFVQPTSTVSVVGTNGATFYITGVQLEVGSTATPFERRLYNQELANCQRYYFKTKTNSGYGPLYSATNNNTTGARGFFFLPVEMRVAPTGINMTGSTPNVGVGTYTSTVIDRATHTCVMLFLSGTGFTSGGASGVYGNADGTSCIDFTGAEL